jgi:hypothetical protein
MFTKVVERERVTQEENLVITLRQVTVLLHLITSGRATSSWALVQNI